MAATAAAAAARPGTNAALAASTGTSANTSVTLVAERASIQPGRPFTVGIRMNMKQGWHTYWKNPGDSGLPTSVDWKLPRGFAAGPIEWPAPARMPLGPEMSYGYAGEVLLPVLITPPETIDSDSVTIAGAVRWLECADVCLPGSATLDLTLPVSAAAPAPGPAAASFDAARSLLPRDAPDWELAATAGPRAISLEFRPPKGIVPRDAYLFVDQPLVADYVAPQPWGPLGQGFRLTASPAANASGSPERLTGVLALENGAHGRSRIAIRVDVPVAIGDPSPYRARSRGSSEDLPWTLVRTILYVAPIVFFTSLWKRPKEAPPPVDPRTNGGHPGVV